MYKFRKSIARLGLLSAALLADNLAYAQGTQGSAKFPGVGRNATPVEIVAWDIDVRPDFKVLPKGSGSVEQGNHLGS